MTKTIRVVGAVFVVVGLIFALVGILASVVPLIQNEHFKLILSSFQEISSDSLTNTLNGVVRFCLHSSYFLLFCGIALMVIGGLISSASQQKRTFAELPLVSLPEPHAAAESPGIPKPAYYPGGMAPSAFTPVSGREAELLFKKSDPVADDTFSKQKNVPISGGIEPSFTAEVFDAQNLIRRDRKNSADTRLPKPQPDYEEFLSNAEQRTRPETPKTAVRREGPDLSVPAEIQPRPRIVSTVGKRRF